MSIRYLSGINVDSNTLVVDEANNRVGISSGSPDSKLRIQNDNATIPSLTIRDGGTPTEDHIRVSSNAYGDSFFVKANGNVGIGTASPAATLEVKTQNGIRASRPSSSQYVDLYYAGIEASPTNDFYITAGTGYGTIFSANGSERMRITSAGNVGIGTTSPHQKLVVDGLAYLGGNSATSGLVLGTLSSVPFIQGYDPSGTNNTILFYTGVTEKMRITSGGNVGIGTSSPLAKLHVEGGGGNGTAWFGGTSVVSHFNYSTDEHTYIRGGKSTSSVYIADNNTGNVFIANGGGNVGIGTTAPSAYSKLQVKVGTDFNLAIGQDTGAVGIGAYNDAVNATANLNITGTVISFSSGGERMRITSAGNVGIGTTSPTNKLHIDSTDDNAYALRVQGNTNNGAGVWTGIGIAGENANTKTAILFEDVGVSYSRGKLHFALNNSADQTSATPSDAVMTLIPEGNVGIGVTDPEKKLEVKSDTTYDGILIDTLSAPEIVLRDRGNSDTLVGTGRHGLDSFHIDTYSGNAFFIKGDTRNVGINTTSPSEKLHVDGNVRVTGKYYDSSNSEGTSGQVLTSTGAGTAWVSGGGGISGSGTTNYVTKWTSSSAVGDSSIYDNGNVGIGTTSPQAKLDVSGNIWITGRSGAPSSGLGMELFYYSPSGQFYIETYDYSSSQYKPLIYSASTHSFLSGNVGIGTTSPSYKLDVSGAGRFSNGYSGTLIVKHNYSYHQPNWAIKLDGDSGTSGGYLSQWVDQGGFELAQGATYYGGGPWRTDANSTSFAAVAGYGGILTFSTDSGLTANSSFYPSERMRITQAGNVGIGTTSPLQLLQVQSGNVSITSGYSIYFNGPSDANWRMGRNIISETGNELSDSTLQFVAANASEQGWQFVDDDGNTRFEVEGGTGNAWFNTGNLVVAGTITENSSIRYKENIEPIEDVSDNVMKLAPVTYNKIGKEETEIGLIAEEVHELFPEVVKYNSEGQPDGINYTRLSVILLKAVQELTERVNKLENK